MSQRAEAARPTRVSAQTRAMEAGMAATKTRSKIDEYCAGAERCEQRAKKTRNQAAREWQTILARAYRILAEAET